VVGARIAGNVTHAEEHHGDLPESWPRTSGRVVSITSAFSRHAPVRTDGRTPVAGSMILRDVSRADDWEDEADGLRFNGYVVEFENSHEPT
jgi:hypothetical protein